MEKRSKISNDGKNLLTRIPKKIKEEVKITEKHNILWSIKRNKLKIELEKDGKDCKIN